MFKAVQNQLNNKFIVFNAEKILMALFSVAKLKCLLTKGEFTQNPFLSVLFLVFASS